MTESPLLDALSATSGTAGESAAILAPSGAFLSRAELVEVVSRGVATLRECGVTANDTVALILPPGAEAAVSLLVVMCGAVAAPLDHALPASQLEARLREIRPTAIIVAAGRSHSMVRGLAHKQRIAYLEAEVAEGSLAVSLRAHTGFSPVGEERRRLAAGLLLGTSGTTLRPKLVALDHERLLAWIELLNTTLELSEQDRSLDVMPLHHAHGIVIALLAPLFSGGSVVVPSQSDLREMTGWIDRMAPTWISASPAFHRAIAETVTAWDRRHPLRFVRSSAAPLTAPAQQELEAAYRCPVIQGYGMTECIQIASNPFPPGHQKPGSVGLPAGPEIKIVDGLIAIRHSRFVVSGYVEGPEAPFGEDGWFATGDSGHFDDDGYLVVTGRRDDVINRGGAKVSPAEVEQVLLEHPDVSEAVVFPVPHQRVGEEVAAIVIPAAGRSVETDELRQFALRRLPEAKAPRRILVMMSLPHGAAGKIQRRELAARLNLDKDPRKPTPLPLHTRARSCVSSAWQEILGHPPRSEEDDFFAAGGDSLLGAWLVTKIRSELGIELPLRSLFENPTFSRFAEIVSQLSRDVPVVDRLALPARERPAMEPERIATVRERQPSNDAGDDSSLKLALFFFSADGSTDSPDKYRLFREAIRFADQNGFSGVWIPERHFHPFGGLYPNPSVLGAAAAMMTERLRIRAGSVVLPLQDPIRVAEEWAVVDNLSRGRAEIACASGWHTNDFVLSPSVFENRKRVMRERIDIIQRLWGGGVITRTNGAGVEIEVRTYPRPLQTRLPIWLAAHGDETFELAGSLGLRVVTTLYETKQEEVARRIGLYRESLRRNGHADEVGRVALMLHTYVGESAEEVREQIEIGYGDYLFVNLALQRARFEGLNSEFAPTPDDERLIRDRAVQRLLETTGLVGTMERCRDRLEEIKAIGVDEVACLVDFGISREATLASLERLVDIQQQMRRVTPLQRT